MRRQKTSRLLKHHQCYRGREIFLDHLLLIIDFISVMTGTFCQRPADGAQRLPHADLHHQHLQLPGEAALELQTKICVDFTFTEKAVLYDLCFGIPISRLLTLG